MDSLTPAQVDALLAGRGASASVYLIGAGGCGMSALGHLLLDLGHPVAGADLAHNEEVDQLRARGAAIHIGHSAEQLLVAKPALVVYSSAIAAENPEWVAARQQRIPTVRRAVLLAALLRRQRSIGVAGMHGKTTTTALLAYALEQLGVRPSYAVGASIPQLRPHARFCQPPPEPRAPGLGPPAVPAANPAWFVAEIDESDGTLSLFDPCQAIILNVDEEHLDHYANLQAVCDEVARFARQTRDLLVYCADDPRLVELFSARPRACSFGFRASADYRLELLPAPAREGAAPSLPNSPSGAGTVANHFAVWRHGDRLGEFSLQLIGKQNVSNAGAVIALLHQSGFAPGAIAGAIGSFNGVDRRQQELYRDHRFRLFEDYGHHPREIRATLEALKELGGRRLLVAFQPHRFTRTLHLQAQFAACFAGADRLWITEVYAASEAPIAGVDGGRLAAAVRATGQSVDFVGTLAELKMAVRSAMAPGDLVLFLGAGDITKAARELADQLRAEKTGASEEILETFFNQLARQSVVKRNEPMARHTTWRVGGRADWYVEPASEQELAGLLEFCACHKLPFRILGRGSNILIRDGGIRGVVICLAHPSFSRLEAQGRRLRCGAGAKLREAALEGRRQGLGGLEFLEGIPGSVGGAMRMNAGAMGSSFYDIVEQVRIMDYEGRAQELPRVELTVNYRSCPLFHNHIALAAVLVGQPTARELIEQKLNAFNQKRWHSQPAAPSAGCVFKNPASIPAGKLIEELGLKGTRVGGAVVSEVHANFIVNDKNATARDILSLIDLVKQRAWTTRQITLETEVEIVGEPGN